MQNYYRLLGVSPLASVPQIQQAYARQRTRLGRLATADPAMRGRLAEVEAGYSILVHPRRRLAYDALLAQEPPAPPRLSRTERLLPYARWARRLNVALLACCLLLGLDWALPAAPLSPTKPCAAASPSPYRPRSPTRSWPTACTRRTPPSGCPAP